MESAFVGQEVILQKGKTCDDFQVHNPVQCKVTAAGPYLRGATHYPYDVRVQLAPGAHDIEKIGDDWFFSSNIFYCRLSDLEPMGEPDC